MSDPRDLSGVWYGRYAATTRSETNSFIAQIEDREGALSGVISEPDTTGYAEIRRALVSGRCDGSSIRFVKQYQGPALVHAVLYAGTVNEDATEISGQWVIVRSTGSFVMQREKFAAEELADEREVEEELR
ncbi:hypothetical protein [Sphingomonas sp.]|uniref:hypothetical protein n=1 Tax=Sphingomonas sp. TaxID=28214 RepID=UPI001B0876FC|nr:hypothetical protein [Sphingomonas sp.]MBO9712849.1 hypothetical protein [Sphingomonas sp.]